MLLRILLKKWRDTIKLFLKEVNPSSRPTQPKTPEMEKYEI